PKRATKRGFKGIAPWKEKTELYASTNINYLHRVQKRYRDRPRASVVRFYLCNQFPFAVQT
ncbi:MAG: hypothetical protein R3309_14990, partial [Reinekea sp.]|nr:hypothetical protein [Reinekea sp.]